ncbi:MarR family transcriptional regulator [Candidatus Bathyarchaeota archaeon]|nr:MarR family transcriptional regulator [Candidatus Bathyarchaeota archaeon]
MTSDPFLLLTIILLFMTMGVAILFYRKIRDASKEYKDAKNVVTDIIFSFNNQIENQKNNLQIVAQKMKQIFITNERIIERIEVRDNRFTNFEDKMKIDSEIEQKILGRFKTIDKKIEERIKTQERIVEKIAELEKIQGGYNTEIQTVIPIRKERALAPLTETELMVLETLAREGEKAAPEIRRRIELSREHTSRLMKKLYENGYLERDTRKIPYTYSIKKEMLKILNIERELT